VEAVTQAAALAKSVDDFEDGFLFPGLSLERYLPSVLQGIPIAQTEIPRIARDPELLKELQRALACIPTTHFLVHGDARKMSAVEPDSVHLVLTSPPYWTLKRYDEHASQMGHIVEYEEFLEELAKVWKRCYEALVPGGRLVCVVGDVCLSRRQNDGRHTVVPLHASIQEICRRIGFDNLAPIIWHKIANAVYEVSGAGGFLGKPYEPNSVIKNDIEYILMQRKPGGYRKPDGPARLLSVIGAEQYQAWFQQVWTGVTGASTREHPAPYPVELAERLIRMFSFAGDVVLDPFSGSGTTAIAAAHAGRNSIGFEISGEYHKKSLLRIDKETRGLFHLPNIKSRREL
jgi:DNA modification methylase